MVNYEFVRAKIQKQNSIHPVQHSCPPLKRGIFSSSPPPAYRPPPPREDRVQKARNTSTLPLRVLPPKGDRSKIFN